jgi:outer membrane protein assembly factor BamB
MQLIHTTSMALLLFSACELPTEATQSARVIWRAPIPRSALIPVTDEKQVYFADMDHTLHSVDKKTGRIRWTKRVDAVGLLGFTAGVGLALVGDVVAVPDGAVFGVDRVSGSSVWRFLPPRSGFSWRLPADATTIYAASGDGRVFAIDPTSGAARWEARIADDSGGAAFTSTVFRDTLFVGYLRRTNPRSGGLAALDAKTGARLWYTEFTRSRPNSLSSSHGDVAIVNDLVVVASDGGEILALDRATGALRWQAPRVQASEIVGDIRPLVAVGQLVVAGSTLGTVTAYDAATGAQRWRQKLLGTVEFPFAADARQVYIVDSAGRLVALDGATGRVAWTFGGSITAEGSMLVGATVNDGVVYVGGTNASYALRAHND